MSSCITVLIRLRCGDCGHDKLLAFSDGVYRCDADGRPTSVEVGSPTDDEVHALLQTLIARLMKMFMRRSVLVQDMGQAWLAEPDTDGEEARTLRPLQAAAVTYRIAFGPRAGQKVLTLRVRPLRRDRAASVGHGCSSGSSTSTCSTARAAATGS
jgi:hypothetical protein